jgi:Arc/MetJ-type ribon-helix-helix transcriptional regulator
MARGCGKIAAEGRVMAIQLSPEQESRIQSLVKHKFRESPEKVVNAALDAAELESIGWEGTKEELQALIQEGLNSGEGEDLDDGFWDRLKMETDRMAAEHEASKVSREA